MESTKKSEFFDNCKKVLDDQFKINNGEIEGMVEGRYTMRTWISAWHMIRVIDINECMALFDLVDARLEK